MSSHRLLSYFCHVFYYCSHLWTVKTYHYLAVDKYINPASLIVNLMTRCNSVISVFPVLVFSLQRKLSTIIPRLYWLRLDSKALVLIEGNPQWLRHPQCVFRWEASSGNRHQQGCRNMSERVGTCRNMSEHVTTCQNMSEHVGTCRNMLEHVRACSWEEGHQHLLVPSAFEFLWGSVLEIMAFFVVF